MKGNLFVMAGMLVLIALAGAWINSAYASGLDQTSVTNESVDVNYSQNTTLAAVDSQFVGVESLTVRQNGSELTSGTDYILDADSGTIDWQNTTDTNESNATASYSFTSETRATTALVGVFKGVDSIITWLAILAIFGTLLGQTVLRSGF